MTIIAIVVGAFGTVTKGLLKGLDDLQNIKIKPTTKWYMIKPEFVLKNKMHELFVDFEIQM